ncbi:TPA: hypothetical protein ACPJ1T_004399 [Vibrio diabolicus]
MKLPMDVQKKIDSVHSEIEEIVDRAYAHISTDMDGEIRIKFSISAPRDVLTDFERAQSVCFVTRYDALPEFDNLNLEEHRGRFYFSNFGEARYVLNEFRSIIQNKKDSIHYQQIHRFCRDKLLNEDHTKDLSITVSHNERGDVTSEFLQYLNEHNKAIKSIIKHCEFDYIYNGILQHSDHRFTKRFWSEYASGEANYVFIKHALLTGHLRDLLIWHYRLFSAMTFPKLGPL